MFDIGFSELILIFIVGLVVLGPQRMPVAIRTVVSWIRTLRGLAANVQNELSQELKLQELQESIKKAEALNVQTLSPELGKTIEELKASAQKMAANLNQSSQAMEESIKAATAKVDDAIKHDLNEADSPENAEISEKSTALSLAEQAEIAEQDEIMAHLQKYQTPEDSTTSSKS